MTKIPEKGIASAMHDGQSENANTQAIRSAIIKRQGINAAMPSPRIDHNQRNVVRSSPDLLYTACVYDVTHSPLRLTTPTEGGYTSISAFADNTDNFFVQDDRTAINKQLDITLTAKDWQGEVPNGSKMVTAASNQGIVLFRVLIENEFDLDMHLERQRKARCTPLKV